MSRSTMWRCRVCGHMHEGDGPPETCPVCGVPFSEFEAVEQEPAEETPAQTGSSWRCTICGYIHDGNEPPDECPVCGAPASEFEAAEQQPKKAASDATATTDRIVIAGAGIAGLSAAEAAREKAPEADIILLSAEEEVPYYRLNLTRYLAGDMTDEELPIHPAAWYEGKRIDLRMGKRLQQLFVKDRTLELDDGERIEFDRLILATGATPFVPPIDGHDQPHVHTLRTADDAKAILEQVKNGTEVACIGGGILGLETAGALEQQGATVTVLEASKHLMPMQLNPTGSDVMSKHLYSLNIDVITQAQVKQISAQKVELEDGSHVSADLVVISTGVRAETGLFEDAGFAVSRGVTVDDFMRTSHEAIWAAGDVCEHNEQLYGSWAAAQFQGRIAGMNAAGVPTEFGGIPRSHSLKILGKDMFSIGIINPTDDQFRQLSEAVDDDYRLFTLANDTVVGALLIGDVSLMSACKKAVENRMDVGRISSAEDIAAQLARE